MMTQDSTNRLALLGMTAIALGTVCYLAAIHTISDGETVAALSAALSAYVGGHAVIRQPPNGGGGSGGNPP